MRVNVLIAQSCPTLCDPMACSPPGSSVRGISRREHWRGCRCLTRGSSWPSNLAQVSYTAGRFFTIWATNNYFNSIKQILIYCIAVSVNSKYFPYFLIFWITGYLGICSFLNIGGLFILISNLILLYSETTLYDLNTFQYIVTFYDS